MEDVAAQLTGVQVSAVKIVLTSVALALAVYQALLIAVVSFALVGALTLKLLVLHRWRRLGRFLPVLGVAVLALFVMTWLTSAGAFLVG